MQKTLTINISGIIFHIEEDAFEILSNYLLTIKGYFSKSDGGNEIMSDIEARIAELLQQKINVSKQVILLTDVNYAMGVMGKPEDFAGEAEETKTSFTKPNEAPIKKRLFRDPDNKVLGGVCSGIGHYFGIDSVWLRIGLALLVVFAGTGILIYIILWIAIPEANTTAERLAMKGEKADINNISKAVKEEAEQLKKRMEKYGEEFQNINKNFNYAPRNIAEKIVDFFTTVIFGIGRVLLKITGVFLIIIGVVFFLGLITSLFGMTFMTNNFSIKEWIDMILLTGKDFYLGLIGLSIFIGIPIILIIYSGFKLLLKIRYSNRWLNLSASIVWIIGFILVLYVGVRTGQEFTAVTKVREIFNVKQYDTLYLKMVETKVDYNELTENEDQEGEDGFSISHKNSSYKIGVHDGQRFLLGHAQLNIIKSQTDKIELIIVKESKGKEKSFANERAKNISYNFSQIDSLIVFENYFKINNADKFRMQDVTIILKLPINKIVYLDKTLENLIYDIENITNTYDKNMVNRRWMMKEQGLTCIDCIGLESTNGEITNGNEIEKDLTINTNGINIKSKNSNIVIDKNGVQIGSKKNKSLRVPPVPVAPPVP